jgi:dTDP-4-amino-4,6-dideoxygalactose transaminase
MDVLNDIAQRHGLAVVEDAAQALGAKYKGRNAGSLGQLAAFSFHETKNVISGEGGALAINDRALIERAEIIREKGTNRRKFFRGQVDKYTWVDIGSSFLPGELIASFLYGQLEQMDAIYRDRLATWQAYEAALGPYRARGLGTPTIPAHCTHNAHLYYILMPSLELRQELIARMKQDGINTPFHYVPLHSSPAGKRLARTSGPMRHTEDLSLRLVRLPLFPRIGNDVNRAVERLKTHLDALL